MGWLSFFRPFEREGHAVEVVLALDDVVTDPPQVQVRLEDLGGGIRCIAAPRVAAISDEHDQRLTHPDAHAPQSVARFEEARVLDHHDGLLAGDPQAGRDAYRLALT